MADWYNVLAGDFLDHFFEIIFSGLPFLNPGRETGNIKSELLVPGISG